MSGPHASTATAPRRRGGYEGQHRAEGRPVRCTCSVNQAMLWALDHHAGCPWWADVEKRLCLGTGGAR